MKGTLNEKRIVCDPNEKSLDQATPFGKGKIDDISCKRVKKIHKLVVTCEDYFLLTQTIV